MTFADPLRLGLEEFGRDEREFDGVSYLYANEDVRAEIGFDVEGAWRHWTSVGHLQNRYPPGIGRAAPRNLDPEAMAARPFGLNLFGPFDAISGLGTAARNLLDAVHESGVPFDVHRYDVETGHARITETELGSAIHYRVNLVLANADQIRRLAGLYPDGVFDDSYTIAVWAWELAAFRPDWHASFALVDEIWTNSHFELAAIASVSPVPVHLMPLPVRAPEPPVDRDAARVRFGLPANAFVVLCPFDAGSTEARKNPLAAIDAFRRAFGRDPRRVLVVKHHGGDAALTRRLLDRRGGSANIHLIGARLSHADQQALQAACDALLSAHRSEGFGLNLAEFLAAGRTVIATDYSGSRDFLDESTGYPVEVSLVEVERRAGPYGPHAVWAEPDLDALVAGLRAAASEADDRQRRGAAARARMAEAFSPAAIGARMRARLSLLDGERTTPDGFTPTALASLQRFVPTLAGRDRIAWPARLPFFTLTRDVGDPLDDARDQIYPFWEACLVAPGLPPPEAAAARVALRGDDLRVRLLEPAGAHVPAAITAAEASNGAWMVLLPDGARLESDALLRIAVALDRDAPPDLLSLGDAPLEPALPIVVRKSVLLAAWATYGGALDGLLRHLAGPAVRIEHLPGLVSSAALPPEPVRPALPPITLRAADFSRLAAAARSVDRSPTTDLVVLHDSEEPPDPETLRPLLDRVADRHLDAVSMDGTIATRRDVLSRLARMSAGAERFDAAARSLNLRHIALPLIEEALAASDQLPLALHAARIGALGLFDQDHYLVSSPDVAASGTDPLRHYAEYGWREHRAPNFYFDPVWYRARYMHEDPDETIDPLLHYERYRNSGVRPSRHFDPAWVRRSRHLPPGTDPLRYFLERRRSENVSPLPEFDPAWYRARRRDIVYRKVDPFEHYMRFGAAEGVNPSADFDTAFYAARHMSGVGRRDPVAGNPLLHYLEHRERQPAITSLKAALRQEVARLRLLGRPFIEMSFCWFDGLPQRIDALRTYLAEPTLAMPFLLVFANELLATAAVRAGDLRALAALRLPFTDDYDDADICARLVECFADRRCLRRANRPVLALPRGADAAAAAAFGERIGRRLTDAFGVTASIELVD